MIRTFFTCLIALISVGCLAPTTPAQKLADAAYEMNTASRFGRMDIAVEYVAAKARTDYVKRHASWGQTIRVVDVEFNSVGMTSDGQAEVLLSVAWQRVSESTLRTSQVFQRWVEDEAGWRMSVEKLASGDADLLRLPELRPAPAQSRAAPEYSTRVIPGSD